MCPLRTKRAPLSAFPRAETAHKVNDEKENNSFFLVLKESRVSFNGRTARADREYRAGGRSHDLLCDAAKGNQGKHGARHFDQCVFKIGRRLVSHTRRLRNAISHRGRAVVQAD